MKNVQRSIALLAASGLAIGALPAMANAETDANVEVAINGSLGQLTGQGGGQVGSSGINLGSKADAGTQ